VGGQAAGGSGIGGSGGGGDQGASGGWGDGGSGGGGLSDDDAYLPREGSFKALIFSRTGGFRADGAILGGQQMFEDLAQEYGFEVEMTEETDVFTEVGLREYEVVVFLETTGEILDATAEAAFEQWMKERHGAFVGTLRSADTEFEWEFLDEVRGQNYEGHTAADAPVTIEWNDDSLDFPAVRGLPSPWERTGLWFRLAEYPTWSTKPGFRILGTVDLSWTGDVIVRSAFSFVREHDNFRSFYTGFGHNPGVFDDELVRQHIARGLLWAVRREHWLD
jgi:type 1 glutamine amidotransferase